jgi:hypothetical protein
MRQHQHRSLAPRLPVALVPVGLAAWVHAGLAGIKLSMLIDNLIEKRHDDLVTAG